LERSLGYPLFDRKKQRKLAYQAVAALKKS